MPQCLQMIGGLRRQQDVIDADAVILGPGAGLIVPEGVAMGLGMAGAPGVGEAEIFDRPQRRARFGAEQRIALPGLRVPHIVWRRDDIVVAHQRQRLFELEQVSRHGASAAPSIPACRGTCRCPPDCRWADRSSRRGSRPCRRGSRPRCSGHVRRCRRRAGAGSRPPSAAWRGWRRRYRSSVRGRRNCSPAPRRARRGRCRRCISVPAGRRHPARPPSARPARLRAAP